MTILEVVYASAPTNERIIPSIEIAIAGQESIRICAGFEDEMLGVDGVFQLFEASDLTVALPSRSANANQTLTFGIPAMDGRARRLVFGALESKAQALLIYREYLASDKSEPAARPYQMSIVGGVFRDGMLQIDAAHYDILNTSWPRERYTAETAPALRFL